MSEEYVLEPSPKSAKKWRITTPWGKTVDFGATGYSDYTLHKDPSRQRNYLSRHAARENWTKTGTDTAGFWSRWLLWNLPDLMESVKDTETRFNITIDVSSIVQNPTVTSSSSQQNLNNQYISLPYAPLSPPLSPSNLSLSSVTIPLSYSKSSQVSPLNSLSNLALTTNSNYTVPNYTVPNYTVPMSSLPPLPSFTDRILTPITTNNILTDNTSPLTPITSNYLPSMTSLPPVPRSPTSSPRSSSKSYQALTSNVPLLPSNHMSNHMSNYSAVSLPTVSMSPMASIPLSGSTTYQTNIRDTSMLNEYQQCKTEAAERRSQGKLKLCPEGYCTAKLTEEVYPSYWANLKASKICTGQLEDYEGKTQNYYEMYNNKK